MRRRLPRVSWRAALGAACLWGPFALAGQEPPDSLVTPPDSLRPGVQVVALDSGTVVDTVYTTHPDSVFRSLPALTAGAPARTTAGVTVWDREALLGTPALTLTELLAGEPDLLPLRYGDYGSPETVLGAGMSGGRLRVYIDGFEELPLDGGVPDLSRIALAGIQEVRVERGGGELRILLTSLEPYDPRPLSRVEAGTGDLDTNLFRGTFLHPRALGGTVGLSLERTDSQGRGGQEPGSRQALWFRWALNRGDDLALAFDLRKNRTENVLEGLPPTLDRTSWVVRGRARLAPSLVAEAYTGSATLSSEADDLTPVGGSRRQHGVRLSWDRRFGAAADTVPPRPVAAPDTAAPAAADTVVAPEPVPADTAAPPEPAPADSVAPPEPVAADTAAAPVPTPADVVTPPAADPAVAASGLSGRLWSRADGRLFTGGRDLPGRSMAFEAGFDLGGIGGVSAELRSDLWSDPVREVTATARGVRGWTAPLLGLSLFAGWDDGVRGARFEEPRSPIPEPDTTATEPVPDTLPAFHLSDRTAVHAGVRLTLGPLDVAGTWTRVQVDSVLPIDLLGAREGVAVAGDEVTGFQVAGRLGLPILVDGLSLVGSLLQWESEGWYRPRRRYTGGLAFHNVYKAGNLELWGSFQVQGRDPMLLPRPGAGDEGPAGVRVPFQQSWDAWLQVRVHTVRIFIRSENVTLRRGNQDFPGRLLPQTRSVYGVRWTLWN